MCLIKYGYTEYGINTKNARQEFMFIIVPSIFIYFSILVIKKKTKQLDLRSYIPDKNQTKNQTKNKSES